MFHHPFICSLAQYLITFQADSKKRNEHDAGNHDKFMQNYQQKKRLSPENVILEETVRNIDAFPGRG